MRLYESVDAVGERWLEDADRCKLADIPEIVYHYTDAAGLWGMLHSGKVWATDTRFLNDREEMRHLVRESCAHIEEWRRSGKAKVDDRLYEGLVDSLGSNAPFASFIFSLSSERDDLSQWRGYAREGEGFTIGFVGRALYDLAQQEPSLFAFVQVEYDHARQVRSIAAAVRDMEKAILTEIEKDAAAEESVYAEAIECLGYVIKARAATAKHKSFSAEKEWRILSAVSEEDEGEQIRTRVTGRRLTPFVEIELAEMCAGKLPIETIGIGPGFLGGEVADAVRLLCKGTGYDVPFYFADTPFRRGST